MEGQTVEATRVLLLVAAVVAPVAIWTAWRSREAGAVVVFGVAWYALALIPAALFLAADYVLGSPRLMLVASLGGGLAWGAAGAEIVRATRHLRPRRRWMLWGPLAALPLILALNFLTARRHDFLHLGAFTWRLFDLLDAADIAGQDILIVNAPNYLAPKEPTFLLGAEGATFMLNELGYEQPYWLNTGQDFPAARIDALAYRQTVKYTSRSCTPHQEFVEGEGRRARLGAATRLFTTQFDDPRFCPSTAAGGPAGRGRAAGPVRRGRAGDQRAGGRLLARAPGRDDPHAGDWTSPRRSSTSCTPLRWRSGGIRRMAMSGTICTRSAPGSRATSRPTSASCG